MKLSRLRTRNVAFHVAFGVVRRTNWSGKSFLSDTKHKRSNRDEGESEMETDARPSNRHRSSSAPHLGWRFSDEKREALDDFFSFSRTSFLSGLACRPPDYQIRNRPFACQLSIIEQITNWPMSVSLKIRTSTQCHHRWCDVRRINLPTLFHKQHPSGLVCLVSSLCECEESERLPLRRKQTTEETPERHPSPSASRFGARCRG